MNTTTLLILVALLCILNYTGSWWCPARRRRRSCSPCIVSKWSVWGKCSHDCGNSGIQKRTRSILSSGSCSGCTYQTEDTRECNRDVCRYPHGSPTNYGCTCQKGWKGKCCDEGNLFLMYLVLFNIISI